MFFEKLHSEQQVYILVTQLFFSSYVFNWNQFTNNISSARQSEMIQTLSAIYTLHIERIKGFSSVKKIFCFDYHQEWSQSTGNL